MKRARDPAANQGGTPDFGEPVGTVYQMAAELLISGSQVRALVRPPSSPCKPRVFDVTPNRAFLRGFSVTDFPDLGLCERWRSLMTIFGALSPHPKIPFPAAGLEARSSTALRPQICGCDKITGALYLPSLGAARAAAHGGDIATAHRLSSEGQVRHTGIPLAGLWDRSLRANTRCSVRPCSQTPVLRSQPASLSMRLKRDFSSWALFLAVSASPDRRDMRIAA
jgi:hypothetical protein